MEQPVKSTANLPQDLTASQPAVADGAELSMDGNLLKRLHEIVLDNLKNEQFSVEDLAGEIAYSRSHLHRKLQNLTGQSISQFIRKIRLDQGLELLKLNVGTVSEIAFRVGFGSNTYFIKCFHEQFGYSPGEVKKRVGDGWYSQTQENEVSKKHSNTSQPKAAPLEALHPAASEQLILEIFNEMIMHKPALEKFLQVDEEEGETVDSRLLAYQIIKNYPWPIGVEIRRLFSASLRQSGFQRYQQLQKTISRGIRMLTFILVCEVCNALQQRQVKLTSKFQSAILDLYSDMRAINMVACLNESRQFLKENTDHLVVSEINEALGTAFLREVRDWLDIQKQNELSEKECAELCDLLEQILMHVLKKSAFLVKYKMVNVGAIVVNKSKFSEATFEHHFHMLNSSDSEFRVHQEVMKQFSDSNAVLLMKSVKDARKFLNLSPFVIDTHREELNNKNKGRLKRDIFLLDSYKDEKLHYSGTGVTTSDDLSSLDNYGNLVEEYQSIQKLIKQ